MIAILDYDAGNLKSVEKACKLLGQETVITRERQEILGADRIILPGVGSFGDAMSNLKKFGLMKLFMKQSMIKFLFLEYVWVCSFYLRAAKRHRELTALYFKRKNYAYT